MNFTTEISLVGRQLTVVSQWDACDGLLQRKQRCNVLTDMLFSISGVAV